MARVVVEASIDSDSNHYGQTGRKHKVSEIVKAIFWFFTYTQNKMTEWLGEVDVNWTI